MTSTILLYLDTSGGTGLVGLATFDKVLAQTQLTETNQQASQINGAIEVVCKSANIQLKDIAGVAIVAGPGSYTGLRVSMSTVKGICYALDIPLLCFNVFQLLANRVTNEDLLLMALKAREKEYFVAIYNRVGEAVVAAQHMYHQDLQHLLQQYEGVRLLTDDLELKNEYPSAEYWTDWKADLESWKKLTKQRWEAKAFDDVAYADPLYLKAAYTTQRKKNVL
jgi:tRNA threonylcarbamoyladenosine biosynthesis protein TsaB